ncbi:MAG: hypothetical protein L6Q70_13465 [Thauera sp.]|nr:hypothetical protein [Thauera sp.]
MERRSGRRVRRAPESAIAHATGQSAPQSAWRQRRRRRRRLVFGLRHAPTRDRAFRRARGARLSGQRGAALSLAPLCFTLRRLTSLRFALRRQSPRCLARRRLAGTAGKRFDHLAEALLVVLQGVDLLLRGLQLARDLGKRRLAARLVGLQLRTPRTLLGLERSETIAAAADLFGAPAGFGEVGAQPLDERETRLPELLEVMRVTGKLVGIARRQQRRDAVGCAVHIVATQPFGELAPARLDARGGLALLALEQRKLLLGGLALALDLRQIARCARNSALRFGQRLLRAAAIGLRLCHLVLQVADALLELIQIGASLGDLRARLGERRYRQTCQAKQCGHVRGGEEGGRAWG